MRCDPSTAMIPYAHRFEKRLRAGFVGCGKHAYRNVYPVLKYVPVDLVAVCDRDADLAETFRATWGAQRAYADVEAMLGAEELDVVFVVTGYDDFEPTYPAIAAACLQRGVNVWTEKPPVGSVADVDLIRAATGAAKVAFGFKKAFAPANRRLRAIIDIPEFGVLRTITLRYPMAIPTVDELSEPGIPRLAFLDHLCHPLSVLRMLAGDASALWYTRAPNGAGTGVLQMASGAVASIHFAAGQSGSSPLERTEATGDGANAVVENNTSLTYYRRTKTQGFRSYYAATDFTGELEDAPIRWEPEWSLGTLYNKGLFLLGYYEEIRYFCDSVLNDTPIEIGGIDYADEGIRIFDAFREGPERMIKL